MIGPFQRLRRIEAPRRSAPRAALGARAASIVLLTAALPAAGAPSPSQDFTLTPWPLPGATGAVLLDYFAYEESRRQLWVPASNTGKVDVIDVNGGSIRALDGFKTAEIELRGKSRLIGPSSVALGAGVVYIGNRADSTICVIELATLATGACLPIGSAADGLAAAPDSLTYVAATRELWVTRGAPPLGIAAPDRALWVFDAHVPGALRLAGKIALDGSAEGFAVDGRRHRFYTNLEESGVTVAIDLRQRQVVARWKSGCEEPHGLALDSAQGFLFVACDDRVVTLDAGHDGRILGSIDTGAGVDNIAYVERTHRLFAAAADAARLTVARVDATGVASAIHTVATTAGARGVVADERGRAYLIDPRNGRILKVEFRR